MPEAKKPKVKGVPNKHLHARTTFLYQAATYLTLQAGGNVSNHVVAKPEKCSQIQEKPNHYYSPLALQLGSELHTVSRKGQVRLSADLKRSMCKACSTVLIPGRTSFQRVENDSKGGKKPWADVLVIECIICGTKKRLPIGAKRQQSKAKRKASNETQEITSDTNAVEYSTTPVVQADTEMSLESG